MSDAWRYSPFAIELLEELERIRHLPARERLAFRMLASMTPREREAYVMHDVDGLSYQEAARVLCVTASTVKTLVRRARAKVELHKNTALLHALQLTSEGRGMTKDSPSSPKSEI